MHSKGLDITIICQDKRLHIYLCDGMYLRFMYLCVNMNVKCFRYSSPCLLRKVEMQLNETSRKVLNQEQ